MTASRPAPAEPPRVLFIGGLGRSGSTLLELLLAQSPEVCALGEVVHLWARGLAADERCGCGDRFSGCAFWRQIGERAFGGWSAVDLDEVTRLRAAVDRTRHIPRLARRRLPVRTADQVRQYADYYRRIYRAALAVSGAQVVIDSSKHASLAFALRWADNLDLRVLHLVRDSRGVAHSWSKRVERPETSDGALMPRFSAAGTSVLWLVQNTAFHLLQARTGRVTRMRYEDFAADSHDGLARARALADLPGIPAARHAPDDPPARPAHTVAGNPVRFTAGPIRVQLDEAWRAALPRRRQALVSLLTLPLLRHYGYRRAGGGVW